MAATLAGRIAERVSALDSVRELLLLAMAALVSGDEALADAELERAVERLEGLRT